MLICQFLCHGVILIIKKKKKVSLYIALTITDLQRYFQLIKGLKRHPICFSVFIWGHPTYFWRTELGIKKDGQT